MTGLTFTASGKLLLFGEYLVLRGAQSVAAPLRFGQQLHITQHQAETIEWTAYEQQKVWLKLTLSPDLEVTEHWCKHEQHGEAAQTVRKLLQLIRREKPALRLPGLSFRFDIDFDRDFGFGTSSTLISLISQWSGVNPYLLLSESFGGSGFDIAAATAPGPVLYQTDGLSAHANREVRAINLRKNITRHLLFVYTGVKQVSKKEVASFDALTVSSGAIDAMNAIVDQVIRCNDIEVFEDLMGESEDLLSGILKTPAIRSGNLSDYPFAMKSLGAWGGDFLMATFRDERQARKYFVKKGMSPIFSYEQLIKYE